MSLEELIKERRIIHENKKLVKEFPFLLPKNRFSGEVDPKYNYSYTELDLMPEGWRKAFGLQMCREIKEELVKCNFLNDYRITDIKEKYGTLRWYDNGYPSSCNIDSILNKYEDLSMCYCINCGEPVRYIAKGDELYVCEDCKNDLIKNFYRTEQSFIRLTKDFKMQRTSYKDGIETPIETGVDFEKYWGLK